MESFLGNFMTRFFGHSGRIGRKTMWLGLLALLGLAILLEIILSMIFGFGGMPSQSMPLTSISEAGETLSMTHSSSDWRQLIVLLILAYPLSALWFKRSHDLNKSGLLVVVYLGVAALSYVVGILGLSFVAPQVGMMDMPDRTWLSLIIQGIYVIFALYLLVTLGFISGTKGSNLYGVNPSEN